MGDTGVEYRIRSRLASKADQLLQQLDEGERASLRGMSPTLLREGIPDTHEARFVSLGLAERKSGSVTLTMVGRFAASMVPRL